MMIAAVCVLSLITLALAVAAVHGFLLSGWLLPLWLDMTDAQASIIAQLIFFLAAAWASVLVPLLFGEQLRSLEDAAANAQDTYNSIKKQLEDSARQSRQLLEQSAAESRRQFSSISRYQQMALGYFSGDGVFTDLDDKEKSAFIEGAWTSVQHKVDSSIRRCHGKKRNSINAIRYRSANWWAKVKESNALGDFHSDFKLISDVKSAISKGAPPTLEQLKNVNGALQRVRDFVSPLEVAEVAEEVVASDDEVEVTA